MSSDPSESATARSADGTYPDWWPPGCDESFVRECNCDDCALMIEKLEEYRRRMDVDEKLAGLDSFAGA